RFVGQDFIHRLIAPKCVVAWMVENFLPETHLLEPMPPAQFSRRSRFHVQVVIVKVRRPPLLVVLPRTFLFINVWQILLSEGAVMEPVVSHPAIDHWVHGNRNLERR